MSVYKTRGFEKAFKKRILSKPKLVAVFEEKTLLLEEDIKNPQLRVHALKGTKLGYFAFSVTGDIRVIYSVSNGDIYFIDIGTHNQVY